MLPTSTVVGPVTPCTVLRFWETSFSTYTSRGVGVLMAPNVSAATLMWNVLAVSYAAAFLVIWMLK